LLKGGKEVRLCRTKAIIEGGKKCSPLVSSNDLASPSIGWIEATLNQVCLLKIIEEVGHDSAVDA
jgi:hypothetical protein